MTLIIGSESERDPKDLPAPFTDEDIVTQRREVALTGGQAGFSPCEGAAQDSQWSHLQVENSGCDPTCPRRHQALKGESQGGVSSSTF